MAVVSSVVLDKNTELAMLCILSLMYSTSPLRLTYVIYFIVINRQFFNKLIPVVVHTTNFPVSQQK